jgi:aminoacrylate hydrolase
VVLAAGLGGVARFWEAQRVSLLERFTVVTYDHRGSGQSVLSPPPYSIDGMAEDVLALVDYLGFASVRFVGHSTGGAIGQCLAARTPDRINQLVLSASWSHCDAYFRRLFTLRRDLLTQTGSDMYQRLATLLLYPPDWILAHDDEIANESVSKDPIDPLILAAKIDALLAFDGRSLLSSIRCPTLVVAARDDATIPVYFARALSESISGARLSILDSGGHYCPVSRAQQYTAILHAFLDEDGS